MTPSGGRIEALVMQVQRDFLETPALTLTLPEAQERFGVDEIACEAVLGVLVDARALIKTRDGACVRFGPRLVARPRDPGWFASQ